MSEVVRTRIRLLMEKGDEHQFNAMKTERRKRAIEELRAMMKNGSAVSDTELKELREHGRR